MLKLLMIATGGAVGTLARYGTSLALLRFTHRTGFPVGTLVVNAIGCFLIGYLNGLFLMRGTVKPEVQLMFIVGLLGGFTTFSAFGWETTQLVREGAWMRAAGYLIASNVIGIAMVFAGFAMSAARSV